MEQNPEGLIDVRGMDREVHKSHHVGGCATSSVQRPTGIYLLTL